MFVIYVHKMAATQAYHKFNPSDMPEIRKLRSNMLRSHKLDLKLDRLDKISQAILPDINWNKLTVNVESFQEGSKIKTCMNTLNSSIADFRLDMQNQIQDILQMASLELIHEAHASASTPEIYEAAYNMADKYHERNTKSGKRRRKRSTNKTKQTPPHSPTKFHKASSSPPKSSPPVIEVSRSSSQKSYHQTRQATPARSSMTTSPRPLKTITNTRISPQHQPISPVVAPDSASSPFEFSTQTPQTTGHRHSKPATQPTIKKHYKSTKSSKSKSKSVPMFNF